MNNHAKICKLSEAEKISLKYSKLDNEKRKLNSGNRETRHDKGNILL